MRFLWTSYWSTLLGNNILIGQCVTWYQLCIQAFYQAQYITRLQGHMTHILLLLYELSNDLIFFLNIWIMESLYIMGTLYRLNNEYTLLFMFWCFKTSLLLISNYMKCGVSGGSVRQFKFYLLFIFSSLKQFLIFHIIII